MPQIKHNLLIITPRHLRTDFLSCYGDSLVATPNISRLANEGILFKNFYNVTANRENSFSCMLSSRYQGQITKEESGNKLNKDQVSLFSELLKLNYRTALFGDFNCFEDAYLKILKESSDNKSDDSDGASPIFKIFNLSADLQKFIEKPSREPFVAWLNFPEFQSDLICPKPYALTTKMTAVPFPIGWKQKSIQDEPNRIESMRKKCGTSLVKASDIKKKILNYSGQIRAVDEQIGRIIKKLEACNKLEKTIIVIATDHGELLGYRGITDDYPVFYDCYTRLPAIVRFPDQIWSGRIFNGLTESIDLVPTLLDFLKIEIPGQFSGRSMIKSFSKKSDEGRDTIFCESIQSLKSITELSVMMNDGSYKLTINIDDQSELYKIDDDPKELINLYESPDHFNSREKLTTKLLKHLLVERSNVVLLKDENKSSNNVVTESVSNRKNVDTKYLKRTVPPIKKLSKRAINQILFISIRNNYRSRFAEAVFNYYSYIINIPFSAVSRGIKLSQDDTNISIITQCALEERDIPLRHTADIPKLLKESDLKKAHYVISMNLEEMKPILAEDYSDWVEKIIYWDIYDSSSEKPEDALSRIEQRVLKLLKKLEELI